MKSILCMLAAIVLPIAARAQPPSITATDATRAGMGWKITVTLRHDDTGWDHYADGWEVLDARGRILATRTLRHPHINEQPFTRSLRQVMPPDGTRRVFIRAHCTEGDSSAPLTPVDLPL